MGSEFINIPQVKSDFGNKFLLQSQLEILKILKRIGGIKDLRNGIFLLKQRVRDNLKSIQLSLDVLESKLPETHLKIKRKAKKLSLSSDILDETEIQSLNFEINEIKEKLNKLRDK